MSDTNFKTFFFNSKNFDVLRICNWSSSSKANIRDDRTYVQKILLFFLMGKIGLPRLRSAGFRTGMEIGLTPLCTLTIGFRQDTSCLFNPTAPCTPSHAFTHSLKRLFTTCRVFSRSFTGKT